MNQDNPVEGPQESQDTTPVRRRRTIGGNAQTEDTAQTTPAEQAPARNRTRTLSGSSVTSSPSRIDRPKLK